MDIDKCDTRQSRMDSVSQVETSPPEKEDISHPGDVTSVGRILTWTELGRKEDIQVEMRKLKQNVGARNKDQPV